MNQGLLTIIARIKTVTTLGLMTMVGFVWAEGRFPKPDFAQTGHEIPHVSYRLAAGNVRQFMDLGLLLLALALTTWAVHRNRSRNWTFGIMIACLVYFGFVKKGCVCSIGAIQNVAHALLGNGYAVPLSVVLTFMAPLVVALFFGRVFCAAVCPLGGIQDCFVLKRPIKLPLWLVEALSIFPYAYLAAAVLFAATGTSYLICRFDPFVAFFRLSGSSNMLFFGAVMIGLGVFIARPYCRFLCPYGVLLGWLSRFTQRRVKVTPSNCISCKLCEESCPFDLIEIPREPEAKPIAAKYLKAWLLLLPVLAVLGAVIGWNSGDHLARLNPKVELAIRVEGVQKGTMKATDETDAFLGSDAKPVELFALADDLRSRMRIGAAIAGGFILLMIGLRLIRLTVIRKHPDYEPDQARCVACARCFHYCPVQPDGTLSEAYQASVDAEES